MPTPLPASAATTWCSRSGSRNRAMPTRPAPPTRSPRPRMRGAMLMQNTQVRRLLKQGNRITGVELANGDKREAGTVVLAAGPWTRRLLATAGLELPLHVEPHPMAVLDAVAKARHLMPSV